MGEDGELIKHSVVQSSRFPNQAAWPSEREPAIVHAQVGGMVVTQLLHTCRLQCRGAPPGNDGMKGVSPLLRGNRPSLQ